MSLPETSGCKLSLIVAMTREGLIGRDRDLPWKISADLKRFRSLTMGHTIIMGRTTWDSLGRALPGRTSIVLTRKADLVLPDGVLRAGSLDEAIALAAGDSEPFIIGGGEIYRQAMDRVQQLYVTWVEANIEGDTWFPAWDPSKFRLLEETSHPAEGATPAFTFTRYERAAP